MKSVIFRLFLSIIVIILLIFPFSQTNLNLPMLFVNELLVVDTKYLIIGGIYVLINLIKIVPSNSTNYSLLINDVCDYLLNYSILIILASQGFIHPIIPIIIILSNTIFNRSLSYHKDDYKLTNVDKMQKLILFLGITLILFYNLPFELWNLKVADAIMLISAILSVVSVAQYCGKYEKNFK